MVQLLIFLQALMMLTSISGSCACQQYKWDAASCLSHVWRVSLLSGCTDIVGVQVSGNLTVTGLMMLLGNCRLLGSSSLFLFQWVLDDSIYRILLCVWVPASKEDEILPKWLGGWVHYREWEAQANSDSCTYFFYSFLPWNLHFLSIGEKHN